MKCFEDAAGEYAKTTGETIDTADVQAKIGRIAYEASQDSLKGAFQGCLAIDGNTKASCDSAAKNAYVQATGKTAGEVDDTEFQVVKVEAGKAAVRNLIGACEDTDKAACKLKAKKAFTDLGLPEVNFEKDLEKTKFTDMGATFAACKAEGAADCKDRIKSTWAKYGDAEPSDALFPTIIAAGAESSGAAALQSGAGFAEAEKQYKAAGGTRDFKRVKKDLMAATTVAAIEACQDIPAKCFKKQKDDIIKLAKGAAGTDTFTDVDATKLMKAAESRAASEIAGVCDWTKKAKECLKQVTDGLKKNGQVATEDGDATKAITKGAKKDIKDKAISCLTTAGNTAADCKVVAKEAWKAKGLDTDKFAEAALQAAADNTNDDFATCREDAGADATKKKACRVMKIQSYKNANGPDDLTEMETQCADATAKEAANVYTAAKEQADINDAASGRRLTAADDKKNSAAAREQAKAAYTAQDPDASDNDFREALGEGAKGSSGDKKVACSAEIDETADQDATLDTAGKKNKKKKQDKAKCKAASTKEFVKAGGDAQDADKADDEEKKVRPAKAYRVCKTQDAGDDTTCKARAKKVHKEAGGKDEDVEKDLSAGAGIVAAKIRDVCKNKAVKADGETKNTEKECQDKSDDAFVKAGGNADDKRGERKNAVEGATRDDNANCLREAGTDADAVAKTTKLAKCKTDVRASHKKKGGDDKEAGLDMIKGCGKAAFAGAKACFEGEVDSAEAVATTDDADGVASEDVKSAARAKCSKANKKTATDGGAPAHKTDDLKKKERNTDLADKYLACKRAKEATPVADAAAQTAAIVACKAGAKKAAKELGGSKDDAEAENDLKKGAARKAMKTRGACVKDMEAKGDDAKACDDDAKATFKKTVDGEAKDDTDFNKAIMDEAKKDFSDCLESKLDPTDASIEDAAVTDVNKVVACKEVYHRNLNKGKQATPAAGARKGGAAPTDADDDKDAKEGAKEGAKEQDKADREGGKTGKRRKAAAKKKMRKGSGNKTSRKAAKAELKAMKGCLALADGKDCAAGLALEDGIDGTAPMCCKELDGTKKKEVKLGKAGEKTVDGATKDPETLERSNKKKVECVKRTDGKANKLTDAMSTDEKNANKDLANAADANAKFSGIKLDADARVSMGGKGVKVKGEGQTIAKDGASFEFDGDNSEAEIERVDLRAKDGKVAGAARGVVTVKKDTATDKDVIFAADVVCGTKGGPVLDLQVDAEIEALEKTASIKVTEGTTTMELEDKSSRDAKPVRDRCNRKAATTRRMRALAEVEEAGTVEIKDKAKLTLRRPVDDDTSDDANIGKKCANRAKKDIEDIAAEAKVDIAKETDAGKKKERAKKALADAEDVLDEELELDGDLEAKVGDKVSKAARKAKKAAKRAARKEGRKMLKAKGVTEFEDAADDEKRAEVEQKLDIKKGAEVEIDGVGDGKIRMKGKVSVEAGGKVTVKAEKRDKVKSPEAGATKFKECLKTGKAGCAKKTGSAAEFDGGVDNKGEIAVTYPADIKTDDDVPVPITMKCETAKTEGGKIRVDFTKKEDATRATNKHLVACSDNEPQTLTSNRQLAVASPTMTLSVFVDGKDVSSSYQLTLGAGGYELTVSAVDKLSAATSTAPMTGLVAAFVAIIAVGLNM